MKKIALAAALALASLAAHAQTYVQVPDLAAKPLRFVIGAGFTFGGDDLATAVYDDGSEITLRGGESIALLAGLDYRIDPQFSVQGTIGYHTDRANARNGDLRFGRVPLELLGYYHVNDKVRVGGGLRFVSNITLVDKIDGGFGDVDFKDTTSPVAEIEYLYSPRIGFKLRYVNDKFKEVRSGISVKGDHVGLLVNAYF
ncbi:outer membrane beta-barrel protein [Massilia suwonensis]|uniref:Outer membrane beta-barrel protein n=1 Tax=Massilia suwonensis TaxID=648895 RepID=A0ABW0MNV6_9BURK